MELLVSMDDILSMSKSFDEGIEHLARIFERLFAANLKLKPSKCTLFQRSAKFLGSCVSESGISTDEEKQLLFKTCLHVGLLNSVEVSLALPHTTENIVQGLQSLQSHSIGYARKEQHLNGSLNAK